MLALPLHDLSVGGRASCRMIVVVVVVVVVVAVVRVSGGVEVV